MSLTEPAANASTPQNLLGCQAVSKRYAVTVLDRVDFQLRGGEIHALVGANGAGKSTLCKIIAGLTTASSGNLWLAGQPYAPATKRQAEAAGVQIVQQELNQIGTLTVAENLMLGRWPHRWGRIDRRELHRRAALALGRLNLADLPLDRPVSQFGVGIQQLLEIASALDRQCRVLILDEPTASLSPAECEHLFTHLRSLRQAGVGLIYISHRLDEIKQLTDRVTILRDGRWVQTSNTAELTVDQMVQAMSQPAGSGVERLHSVILGAPSPSERKDRSVRNREVMEAFSCGRQPADSIPAPVSEPRSGGSKRDDENDLKTPQNTGSESGQQPSWERGMEIIARSNTFQFSSHATDRVMLSVQQLTRSPAFADVSLDVHAGERVGIAGLVGSGRTELLRAIFGADPVDSGSVIVAHDRQPFPQRGTKNDRFRHPAEAVAAGLALITEDRKQTGLLLDQSITDNLGLSSLTRFRNVIGAINGRRLHESAERMQRTMDIRCHSLQQAAGTLSGGNQQKVVIGKWLTRQSDIFLFDEPTRGVDVAARWKIYDQMQRLAAEDKAQLIVSSDLDELLEICDRIVVLSAGKIAGEFYRSRWTREAIHAACFTGYLVPPSLSLSTTRTQR